MTEQKVGSPQDDRRASAGSVAPATLGPLPVIAAGGALFVVLLVLVLARWEPLRELDTAASLRLNELVSASPGAVALLRMVTDLGDPLLTVAVLSVLTVVLLIRRLPRLAVWVAVTGAGVAVLDPLVKGLVGRQRPEVPVVVQAATGQSFVSGHALASFTTVAIVLLLALPLVPVTRRAVAYLLAVVVIIAVGFTRVALGVHFVSDVLAGWALAATWTAMTALVLRLRLRGVRASPLTAGLDPGAAPALRPAPNTDHPVVAAPARTLALAAGGLTLLTTVVGGFGLLITGVLQDTWVTRWDRAAVEALSTLDVPALDAPAGAVNAIGSTRVITVVGVTSAVLLVAILRSWRPALLLAVALAGEVTVYLVVSRLLVSRSRPGPTTMDNLPDLASYPSGHAAAAMTLYGALGLIAYTHVHGRWRLVVLAVPALVGLLVAVGRLYRGVHYPTDVLASAVIAVSWLTITYRLLHWQGPPGRTRRKLASADAGERASHTEGRRQPDSYG